MDETNNSVVMPAISPLDQALSDVKQQQAQPSILDSAFSSASQPVQYAITPQEEQQINEMSRQQGYDPALLRETLLKNKRTDFVNSDPSKFVEQQPLEQQPVDENRFDIQAQQPVPVQPKQNLTPEQQEKFQTSPAEQYLSEFGNQQKQLAKVAEAEGKQLVEQSNYYKDAAARITDSQKKIVELKDTYNTKFDDSMRDYEQASEDVKNFKFQDYWADKSTGQKIMAGIAIMLGGYAAGLRGDNVNTGLNVINQNIDRDIERQKMEYQKNKDTINVAQNKYAFFMQKFGDDKLATLAAKDASDAAALNKLNEVAATNKNTELKAKTEVAKSQIEQQRLETKMKFEQAAQQNAMISAISGKGVMDLTPEQELQIQAKNPELHKVILAQKERGIPEDPNLPGISGLAKSKDSAQKFSDYRNEVSPAIGSINRIKGLTKQLSIVDKVRPRDYSKVKAALETELVALVGNLRLPFTGPGQLLEQEYKRLRSVIGDPASFFSRKSTELVKLDTVLNKLKSDVDTRAIDAGLKLSPNRSKKMDEQK